MFDSHFEVTYQNWSWFITNWVNWHYLDCDWSFLDFSDQSYGRRREWIADVVSFRGWWSMTSQCFLVAQPPTSHCFGRIFWFGMIWFVHTDIYLVGGFKHEFYCPFHVWDVILPIDELHHFSGGRSTTNQILYIYKTWCLGYLSTIINHC